MNHQPPSLLGGHVYVVDDDTAVRNAVARGLAQQGYDVHRFPDAQQFLEGAFIFRPAVLVVDMKMPGMTGVDMQAQLAGKGWDMPVVFISGESSVAQSITAMKQGAIEFLSKPFDLDQLIAVVSQGIAQDARRLFAIVKRKECERQLAVLKPRELETFYLLAKGYAYRELMQSMGISLPTAKQYRTAVMKKLQLASLAQLMDFHRSLTFEMS